MKGSVCKHRRRANGADLEETCLACPSQWEGALDDGRAVYARFRHGHLSVGIGEAVEGAVDNAMTDQALYDGEVGDGLDGFMDFEDLKVRLRGLIEFPLDLVVENENPPLVGRDPKITLPSQRFPRTRCSFVAVMRAFRLDGATFPSPTHPISARHVERRAIRRPRGIEFPCSPVGAVDRWQACPSLPLEHRSRR